MRGGVSKSPLVYRVSPVKQDSKNWWLYKANMLKPNIVSDKIIKEGIEDINSVGYQNRLKKEIKIYLNERSKHGKGTKWYGKTITNDMVNEQVGFYTNRRIQNLENTGEYMYEGLTSAKAQTSYGLSGTNIGVAYSTRFDQGEKKHNIPRQLRIHEVLGHAVTQGSKGIVGAGVSSRASSVKEAQTDQLLKWSKTQGGHAPDASEYLSKATEVYARYKVVQDMMRDKIVSFKDENDNIIEETIFDSKTEEWTPHNMMKLKIYLNSNEYREMQKEDSNNNIVQFFGPQGKNKKGEEIIKIKSHLKDDKGGYNYRMKDKYINAIFERVAFDSTTKNPYKVSSDYGLAPSEIT